MTLRSARQTEQTEDMPGQSKGTYTAKDKNKCCKRKKNRKENIWLLSHCQSTQCEKRYGG